MIPHMKKVFKDEGYDYTMDGLTGSTKSAHLLAQWALNFGWEKQNELMEQFFLAYFTRGEYLGD
jgi:predicted DsbA family dithiol-disulfide isomerase